MYFIIAGNPFTSASGGTSYTGLRVAAKCSTLDEVEKKLPDIYERASGLVLVIDENGDEQGEGMI